ncbi:MAG: 3-deoxy-manno-octulosonate cytidylyltransferase [Betaproteobacteria bacterium]|nr:3-deoxy-manno-octulosonate cytidylyltransferase [Betaproteobacteria bacterium]NBY05857.1 3-deoxy-manno-octulosonate cytidylyltransferase [Betaproteobacteria bacterium]
MAFSVLIPARMASTRLAHKPLADIAGVPMVVRVAQRAQLSQAQKVVVATDDVRILQACAEHHIQALLTRSDHVSGSDRLAEACDLLGLSDEALVVNVQGDEPLIEPQVIDQVAQLLFDRPECSMSTVAHAISEAEELTNTHVVKVVLDRFHNAMYFSRATIPHWRDGAHTQTPPPVQVMRHVGIYGYRASFLRAFPALERAPLEDMESLEQLRALWHGHKIAVLITPQAPGMGVDTPEDLERVRRQFAPPL